MKFIDLSEQNPFARMMKMLGTLAAVNGHAHHAQACGAIASDYSLTDEITRRRFLSVPACGLA